MGKQFQELELKFVGPPAEVAALAGARIMRAVAAGPATRARLRSVYFDTDDAALARANIALRLREENGRRIQTVKRTTSFGAIRREEFETEIENGEQVPAPTGAYIVDAALRSASDRLRETAVTTVDRWSQPAAYEDSRFDIAVDLGRAEAPGAGRHPIAEVEIEFVDGDEAHLFELARLMADNTALRLETRSKLETALALRGGRLYRIGKFEKPALDPHAPAVDALQAMLRAIAARIASLQAPIIDVRAVEGVHQMRVALRRFRAIERTFRRAVDTRALYALTRRARAIARALGPARDLDVFLEETAPSVFAREGPSIEPSALRGQGEALRAGAWSDAADIVAGREFTHFLIDLMEAGVRAPWRESVNARGRQSLIAFAPGALDKALRRARKAEAAMDRTALAARHPLRIAMKKLRYTAQMLGPLYPRERRKPYMAALSALQESLGAVNDAVVAQRLADETSAGAGPDAMRAAGFLSGYKLAEADAAAKAIDQAWEIFNNTAPFWREDHAFHTDHPLP